MKRISLFLILLLLLACSKTKTKEEPKQENPLYDKAFEFQKQNMADSAYQYFSSAKDLFLQQRDRFGVAKCLVNMAVISIDKGDYFGGQEISLEALAYFNLNNKRQYAHIESNYHELALASHHLKNYSQAISFYNQSLKYAANNAEVLITKNNIANAYNDQKKYRKALSIFHEILQQKGISKKTYAMTLTNMAAAKWEQDQRYNAIPELLEALEIRRDENDLWGLNSSYSHLSDYYLESQPDSALFYASEMYQIAQHIKSPDDKVAALRKLIKLSPAGEVKHLFSTYTQLNDSLQISRNTAKNQFALIRYETEKNKVDLLKSQADNAKKQNNILRLYIILVLLAAFLVFGYFFYKKRQKNLRQEKEIEVKKTELKYVKKIHDHVANKVYQVMNEIDNTPAINKEELADKLDVIYKISRDLSYEKEVSYEKSFAVAVSKMIYTYASAKVDIQIRGNDEDIWENVKDSTKSEVISILQELMTNMVKHSKAEAVTLDFDRRNQHINILYTDNGKGIATWAPKNGLSNTETRIKSIAGVITFENRPDEGLNIKFSFPIL